MIKNKIVASIDIIMWQQKRSTKNFLLMVEKSMLNFSNKDDNCLKKNCNRRTIKVICNIEILLIFHL